MLQMTHMHGPFTAGMQLPDKSTDSSATSLAVCSALSLLAPRVTQSPSWMGHTSLTRTARKRERQHAVSSTL
jgi:hypothetical protein